MFRPLELKGFEELTDKMTHIMGWVCHFHCFRAGERKLIGKPHLEINENLWVRMTGLYE